MVVLFLPTRYNSHPNAVHSAIGSPLFPILIFCLTLTWVYSDAPVITCIGNSLFCLYHSFKFLSSGNTSGSDLCSEDLKERSNSLCWICWIRRLWWNYLQRWSFVICRFLHAWGLYEALSLFACDWFSEVSSRGVQPIPMKCRSFELLSLE